MNRKEECVERVVSTLLKHANPEFSDLEFGRRVILHLARKLSSSPSPSLLQVWQSVIENGEDQGRIGPCVPISRPRDGRLTVTKSANSNSSKKIFPQITLCQLFRWPQVVFHNDIKSDVQCSLAGPVKPILNDASANAPSGDSVCINPYHYVLSSDGNGRIAKNIKRDPGLEYRLADDKSNQRFNDHGIDYIKMWEEKSNSIEAKQPELEEITESLILKEIRFLPMHLDQPLEPEISNRLSTERSMKNIFNNKYVPSNRPKQENVNSLMRSNCQQRVGKEKCTKNDSKDKEERQSSSSHVDFSAALEDTAIQDLLDDIRGSFERQFDDDFGDLTRVTTGHASQNIIHPTSREQDVSVGFDFEFPQVSAQSSNVRVSETHVGEYHPENPTFLSSTPTESEDPIRQHGYHQHVDEQMQQMYNAMATEEMTHPQEQFSYR